MLDIVITHYKEPWEVCRPQFGMLDMQRHVDWNEIRVTVVNDGGHRLPEEELRRLSFPVNQVDLPHGGVSRARNCGLDLGTEPWIMFCDCDDCFSNVYALEDVMNVLKSGIEGRFDLLWTHCWEEERGGVTHLIPNSRVFVFCHGKIYSRAFLLREQVRFEESLTFNEDSCFNACLLTRTTPQRAGEIRSHTPVYTWIRREGSVTADPARTDEGTYCNFRRNVIVTEENRKHRPDQYPAMVTRTAYDVFYMIHQDRITASCKQQILNEFRPWIRMRREAFGDVSGEILDGIRAIARDELLDEEIHDGHEEVRRGVEEVVQT